MNRPAEPHKATAVDNVDAAADDAVTASKPAPRAYAYGALVIVAIVALALRLLYLWQLQQTPMASLLFGDALAYDTWAQKLAAGDWVGSGVFYQAPLYPYFLGVIYALAGHDLLAVRLVQCVLGAGGCVLLAMAGQMMFGKREGFIAGLMLAIYPASIFFDGLIQKSALDLPLLCLALWLLVIARLARVNKRSFKSLTLWLLSGVSLGLLMLTRENALVFVAAAALWALWPVAKEVDSSQQSSSATDKTKPETKPRLQAGLPALAMLLAGLMLALSPVLVRNKMVGGEFHLTTSQLGPNLYIGNHAGADGSYQPLRFGRGDAAYERHDATELAQEQTGRTLTPSEVSSYWIGQTLDYIRHDTADFLRLIGRKAMLLINAVEITDTEGQYAYSDYASVLRMLGWWNMGLLLPLAAFGAVMNIPRLKAMWLLPACLLLYSASVIAFYVFARYRLPVVPLLMLIAAMGVISLPELIRSRLWAQKDRAPLFAAGAAVVAAILSHWPLLNVDSQRAISYASFAAATQKLTPSPAMSAQAIFTQADAFSQKAVALAPHYAGASYNHGLLLLHAGKVQEAIVLFENSVQLAPDFADGWNQLGLARMQAGDVSGAIIAYYQALITRPRFAQAHNNLGVALAHQGMLSQALDQYKQAIALDPAMAEAHNNLGTAMAREGRLAEAAMSFETALKLNPDYADAKSNLDKARKLLAQEQNITP